MNYIIYAKFPDEKNYGAMDLNDGSVGVGLMYATLIPTLERAKQLADSLPALCSPNMKFQVRPAGKNYSVYQVG